MPSCKIPISKPPSWCLRHIPVQTGVVLSVVLGRTEVSWSLRHQSGRCGGERGADWAGLVLAVWLPRASFFHGVRGGTYPADPAGSRRESSSAPPFRDTPQSGGPSHSWARVGYLPLTIDVLRQVTPLPTCRIWAGTQACCAPADRPLQEGVSRVGDADIVPDHRGERDGRPGTTPGAGVPGTG